MTLVSCLAGLRRLPHIIRSTDLAAALRAGDDLREVPLQNRAVAGEGLGPRDGRRLVDALARHQVGEEQAHYEKTEELRCEFCHLNT